MCLGDDVTGAFKFLEDFDADADHAADASFHGKTEDWHGLWQLTASRHADDCRCCDSSQLRVMRMTVLMLWQQL